MQFALSNFLQRMLSSLAPRAQLSTTPEVRHHYIPLRSMRRLHSHLPLGSNAGAVRICHPHLRSTSKLVGHSGKPRLTGQLQSSFMMPCIHHVQIQLQKLTLRPVWYLDLSHQRPKGSAYIVALSSSSSSYCICPRATQGSCGIDS
jgi:hypothetical protein